MPDYVQYGALGLLTLVLIWHGKVLVKILDRALKAFDRTVETLDAIKETLAKMEVRLDRVERKIGLDDRE